LIEKIIDIMLLLCPAPWGWA